MAAHVPAAESLSFSPSNHHLRALVVLTAVLLGFIATDPCFTFLDDETNIVNAARQPALQTLGLFWTGQGQHEHPPLSDLLLHFWLPIGGSAPWLVRFPSELSYLVGLFLLALSAEALAGPSAFTSMIYVGSLWAFAFHFARMAGWYSLCFLIAAAMTFSYFRYLAKPSWGRLTTFVGMAAIMLYSNYYAWALISCFALDMLVRRGRKALKVIMVTFGTLVIAYTPMWAVFMKQLSSGIHIGTGPPLISRFLDSVYCLYSLLVSESVAPWFWLLSIPVSLAIVLSVAATMVLLPKQNRILLVYFALLFGGMATIGIIGTKRLLFISGWLLLSFSIALANRRFGGVRAVLVASLAFVTAVGWVGIVTRRWYAAPHFIEPWAEIAAEAAVAVKHGAVVVSNSPTFLFYANYALRDAGLLRGAFSPGWVDESKIGPVERWSGRDLRTSSTVLFVKGVNISAVGDTERVESWLRSGCALLSIRQILPDSGYAMKKRFFRGFGQRRFRIQLETYRCPARPSPSDH